MLAFGRTEYAVKEPMQCIGSVDGRRRFAACAPRARVCSRAYREAPERIRPGLTQILYLVRANRPDCVDK